MEPADALASIGPNPTGPRNISIITGDSGNGMTHAAIAALLLGDQINRRDNPWSRLYDPGRRLPLHATGDYLRENLNTALQYRDWLRPGEARDDSAIPPGQGAVIRRGLKQLAVYKHPDGHCTCLDATCTHLGGIVHWNSQEETWDCPCHASRFDRHGRVLHGPAIHDLKPVDAESHDARETPHTAAQPT
jgi:nitrite reductase/ring-hydroxylating ferredoxin subunit